MDHSRRNDPPPPLPPPPKAQNLGRSPPDRLWANELVTGREDGFSPDRPCAPRLHRSSLEVRNGTQLAEDSGGSESA